MADQTQSTGTLTDTPPAAPIGNIKNVANDREIIVGYFTASSMYKMLYWLQRNTNPGAPIGLFRELYGRTPTPPETPSRVFHRKTAPPSNPKVGRIEYFNWHTVLFGIYILFLYRYVFTFNHHLFGPRRSHFKYDFGSIGMYVKLFTYQKRNYVFHCKLLRG